jgi:flavin-dependent dehydrogenase
MATRDSSDPNPRYDVAILGGGLAGLTLAIQLKSQRPETSIVVLDKREGAAPEAAFKVGESTVPAGAHYFAEVVGLREHLLQFHIRKNGLRFFLPAGDNTDITRRIEIGPDTYPPHDNFQIDRGRFENHLTEEASGRGADVQMGCSVRDITFGPDVHTVDYVQGNEERSVEARWVVDAAGRAGLIKGKLGLGREVAHTINASWFRLAAGLDFERWGADNADWLGRMREVGIRQFSTNHLMGEGYWVWLIPLGSGFISIGACTDPRLHPYDEFNTLERLFAWFDDHEPQLAAAVRPRIDEVEDFLTLEDFAYGADRVYSPDRWTLVGEAGLFADPFYSPGSDIIGYSNTFTTELISGDLDGKDVSAQAEWYNDFHLRTFESVLSRTEDHYPTFGNPWVMTPKLAWDALLNHSGIVFVMIKNKLGDFEFLKSVQGDIDRIYSLNIRMQQLFRDWHELEQREWEALPTPIPPLPAMIQSMMAIMQPFENDDQVRAKVAHQADVCEAVSVAIFHKAARALPEQPDPERRIKPYAVSLRPEAWEDEGLYDESGLTLEEANRISGGTQTLFLDALAAGVAGPPMGGPPGGPPAGLAPGGPPAGVGAQGPPGNPPAGVAPGRPGDPPPGVEQP